MPLLPHFFVSAYSKELKSANSWQRDPAARSGLASSTDARFTVARAREAGESAHPCSGTEGMEAPSKIPVKGNAKVANQSDT